MTTLYTNNAVTTLNGAINDTTTTIVVTDGSVFPTPTGADYFWLTLTDDTNIEIVQVTARSTNTLTVVRGQDGTSGTAFADGDKAQLRITAAGLGEFAQTADLNISNWDTAFGWGDHGAAGYAVKSADETITGNWEFTGGVTVTSSGTEPLTLSRGGSGDLTITHSGSGDLALSHSGSGDITIDGAVISPTLIGQWNTAYSWGDHGDAGYLTSASAASIYLPLSGGTLTGNLAILNGDLFLTDWDSSDTDINGLFPGSSAGGLIQGQINGHLTMALRENESTDAFSIISGGGNYTTDSTYDTLIAAFYADGYITFGTETHTGWLTIAGSAGSGVPALSIETMNVATESAISLHGNAVIGGETSVTHTFESGGYLRFGQATASETGAAGFSEGMRLNATGLGIGTTSPGAALEVVGAVIVSDNGANDFAKLLNSGTTSALELGNTEGTGGTFRLEYARSSGLTRFYTGSSHATSVMTFTATGNVGIATTSPAAPLDVNGNGIVRGQLNWGSTGAEGTLSANGDGTFRDLSASLVTIDSSVYNNHLKLTRITEDWRVTPSTDGSLDILRSGGTGTGRVDFVSVDVAVDGDLSATGQILAPNGSASAPSYSFTSNPDSGLWVASDGIYISFNSPPSNQFRVNGAGFVYGEGATGTNTGAVGMTVNDGYGNASVVWNHFAGMPDQTGSSYRIETTTDSTTALMRFRLADSVTAGVAVQPTDVLALTTRIFRIGNNGEEVDVDYYTNSSRSLNIYNGATQVGQLGATDTTWFRINQSVDKNIYTPRMIRADGGFQVDAIPMLTSDAQMRLNDSKRFYWGNGDDAQTWSDGTNLILQMSTSAIWYIRDNAGTSKFLIHPNSNYIRLEDSSRIDFGSGNDFRMFHNGSNMYTDMYTGAWYIRDNATNRFLLNDTGAFTATSNITAYGSVSDINAKEKVSVITKALDKVKTLDGILYNYKGEPERMTGVIAQQVRKVLPEAVYDLTKSQQEMMPGRGKIAVRHGNMVGLLIEAIKDLAEKVEYLEEQLEDQK